MQSLLVRFRISLFSIAAFLACFGTFFQTVQAQKADCSRFMDVYDEVDLLDSEVSGLWDETEELHDRYWDEEIEDGAIKEIEAAISYLHTNWKATRKVLQTWRDDFDALAPMLKGSCSALASDYLRADKQYGKIEARMKKVAPLVTSLRADMTYKERNKSFNKITKGLTKTLDYIYALSGMVDDLESLCEECYPSEDNNF